jgi:NAD(P)H dehydrogenase (quinone)
MRGIMKISVILAHPRKGSFNHAIAETAVSGLRDADLPPLVAVHCRETAAADGLVIVHPNWWGMPPAILKGWIDRVLRPGVAYRFLDSGEGVPIGLLKAQSVIIFNTSNTPALREHAVFLDPLERIWRDCIVSFCGVPGFYRRMFGVVVTSTEEQRREWLGEVRKRVLEVFPPGPD